MAATDDRTTAAAEAGLQPVLFNVPPFTFELVAVTTRPLNCDGQPRDIVADYATGRIEVYSAITRTRRHALVIEAVLELWQELLCVRGDGPAYLSIVRDIEAAGGTTALDFVPLIEVGVSR